MPPGQINPDGVVIQHIIRLPPSGSAGIHAGFYHLKVPPDRLGVEVCAVMEFYPFPEVKGYRGIFGVGIDLVGRGEVGYDFSGSVFME